MNSPYRFGKRIAKIGTTRFFKLPRVRVVPDHANRHAHLLKRIQNQMRKGGVRAGEIKKVGGLETRR